MNKLMFCLMGPTASGKTALACELLNHFPVEIISVDSAMIYRGMNIGTAKPDLNTLVAAPHHLIDIRDPTDAYSAAEFCEDVDLISQQIFSRSKIPLLVGGTMMYFRALQQGLSVLPTADEQVRAALIQQAERHGSAFMHQELERVDPKAAKRIHPKDAQRIQRALEVFQITNRPLSELLQADKRIVPYQFVNLLLVPDERAWLHHRIALRFDELLSAGLINEVEGLLKTFSLTADNPSMRCVGYRQVISFLQGEYDLETLRSKGIAATRQLAKRQLTWLRHWPNAHVYAAENPASQSEIIAIMQQILDNPG